MNLPGFVDLQVNGYLGIDFSGRELTAGSCAEACRRVLQTGTAAFLPTMVTSPPEVYERNLPILAEVVERAEFRGRLPGIHLEGPFISRQPGAVGAHNPRWVRDGDAGFLDRLLSLAGGRVRLLTLAAKVPGAEDVARAAVGRGVVVSLGHSLATAADVDRLAAAGATALTHLGNGVPNMLHRHENPIWAGLADDRLTAMLIADGHHLPPPVLKSMIRAKGVERTVVVSDASALAGMPPGRYGDPAGEQVVLEPSGRLHIPARQCLAGSSAVMMQCMNHLASLGLVTLEELLAIGFHNPLRLIGVKAETLPPAGRLEYDQAARRFSWSL